MNLVDLSFLLCMYVFDIETLYRVAWYSNTWHVTEKKKYGFLPWQKFSPREERAGDREEKTRGVESMKDDVRRININATVRFLHLPSAPFQSRWRDSTIKFSLFLPSLIFPVVCLSATRNSRSFLRSRLRRRYVCSYREL